MSDDIILGSTCNESYEQFVGYKGPFLHFSSNDYEANDIKRLLKILSLKSYN